jgi:aerobic-type carbon monoxide dehydrogenase small subunit (CoxS/CutS family)
MARRSFTLLVNGESRQASAQPDEPLLWVIRDELKLTGTKFGCGEGDCGACTVLVDGEPIRSCVTTVGEVADGEQIVTIEGLGQPGNLSPLQAAFADHTAFGCGYCTPGMIVEATALLESNPAPSRPEIVRAMDDHLCRCAAYPNIVTAIESVADRNPEGESS